MSNYTYLRPQPLICGASDVRPWRSLPPVSGDGGLRPGVATVALHPDARPVRDALPDARLLLRQARRQHDHQEARQDRGLV